MIAIHKASIIVFINKTGAAFLGAEHPDEIIGRSVTEFVHPNHRDAAGARISELLEGEGRSPVYEQRVVGLDGTERFIEVVGTQTSF